MARVRFELDPQRSQVWITGSSSVHPIHATAAGLQGSIELAVTASGAVAARPAVEGEVRIAIDQLKASNPLVERETRRRIDARRYPEIVGTVTSSTRLAADRLALAGAITFRGETRPVDGELVVEPDGDDLRLHGEQRFDVRDWGLQPPRIGLLRVHPDIAVRFEATALRS
ncbi:YceI family protein [Aquihabitans sp. McL0605]|uniref:YceI family protein n=1 Tax=Aquihabitans sp. McL0605 TaxID=3415671 RepID=UPI003CFA17E9